MKRRLQSAVLAAVALLLGSLVARAYDTSWVGDTQPVSASKLKADLDEAQMRLGALEAAVTPAGVIVSYAGPVTASLPPPAGWLLCDGSQVSRVTYSRLYASIGNAWGNGDGATTFHLPDLRGRFLRATDSGLGRDPDATLRIASNAGGNTGDAVGTLETSAFASHTHGVNDPGHSHGSPRGAFLEAGPGSGCAGFQAGCVDGPLASDANTAGSGTGITISSQGGTETRPVNASVNYIIKY